jgi:hypothetical protein
VWILILIFQQLRRSKAKNMQIIRLLTLLSIITYEGKVVFPRFNWLTAIVGSINDVFVIWQLSQTIKNIIDASFGCKYSILSKLQLVSTF